MPALTKLSALITTPLVTFVINRQFSLPVGDASVLGAARRRSRVCDLALVGVEPVKHRREVGCDDVAVIPARHFDVFDLGAKLLARLNHHSRAFYGNGRVLIAVHNDLRDMSDL